MLQVNINFWITPDEANLVPDSGGLVVSDAQLMSTILAAVDRSAAVALIRGRSMTLRPLLAGSSQTTMATLSKSTTGWRHRDRLCEASRVPYRQNRCVLFNSNLFHHTDHLHFRPGYRTRRINITLQHGLRQPPASMGSNRRVKLSARGWRQ